jgi:predicted DsbA family dithiol-disulfide isomerase
MGLISFFKRRAAIAGARVADTQRGTATARAKLAQEQRDVAVAQRELAEEQKEEEYEQREVHYQRKLIAREESELTKADKLLKDNLVKGMDEIKDLTAIRDILQHVLVVRNQGEAVKYKQALLSTVSASASIIKPINSRIIELESILNKIKRMGLSGVMIDKNIKTMNANIQLHVKKSGLATPLSAQKAAHAAQIAHQAVALAEQKEEAINKFKNELDSARRIEQESVNIIKELVDLIHNNNFPGALTVINQAINDAERNKNLFNDIKNLMEGTILHLETELGKYNWELTMLAGRTP